MSEESISETVKPKPKISKNMKNKDFTKIDLGIENGSKKKHKFFMQRKFLI